MSTGSGQSGIIGRIIASISPPKHNGVVGKIVSLPQALAQNAQVQAQNIEGEVVQHNRDGSVRVQTSQGNIDINVREQNRPNVGEKVDIAIPKGNPPRQITVQPAPQGRGETQSTPQTSTPRNTSAPSQTTQSSAPQPATPQNTTQQLQNAGRVSNDTAQAIRQTVQASPTPPLAQAVDSPDISQTVRLNALTPLQTQQAVEEILAQLFQSTTSEDGVALTKLQQSTMNSSLPAVAGSQGALQSLLSVGQDGIDQILQQFFQNRGTVLPLTQTFGTPILNTSLSTPLTLSLFTGGGEASSVRVPGMMNLSTLSGNSVIVNLTKGSLSFTGEFAPSTMKAPLSFSAQIEGIEPSNILLRPAGGSNTGNTGSSQSTQFMNQILAQAQNPGFTILKGSPSASPGLVVGSLPNGQSLLLFQSLQGAFPQGFLVSDPAQSLRPGQTIFIQPQSQNTLIQPSLTGQIQPAALMQAGLDLLRPGSWPLMDDVLQTMLQSSPQAIQNMTSPIPNTANGATQISAAAFLFIAAVRSGDLGGWLGQKNIELLQRIGKSSSLGQLGQELSSLSKGAETSPSEWRSIPLPLFYDGQTSRMILHTREDKGDNSQDEKDGRTQTRFLFDLDLTRMGQVQLDGLIREDRLDLIIRTQTPLSEGMRQAMRQAYTQALDGSALYGELGFQGDAKHWVNVLKGKDSFTASA